ncbi:GspH/FimT family pseudopilin [Gammaproteobacteria bacterium]|jgi:type IV fimbrial biogenesis protein FimT|nr:GspH/FimT family pseudopilin [Gammaproteobacteria bacterium]
MSVFQTQRSNQFFLNSKGQGFSLIETLVVIALLAIFAVFAIPMFGDLTQNNRMRAQVSNLVGQFAQARTEAMRRGFRVTMCPGTETGCSGNQWENGLIAFVDIDADGVRDSGEEIILVGAALTGNNTMRSDQFSTFISFRYDGASTAVDGSANPGSFVVCDSRGFGEHARALNILATGRIKIFASNESDSGVDSCEDA